MLKVSKIIIVSTLVILTVFISGCLDTQVAQIDQLSETINDHLTQGDSYFNQAATSSNKYQYDVALQQCNNATGQFNLARNSAQEALIYAKNIQDQIYITYFQITLQEVDAKINATNELKVALPLFMNNDTKTANNHVDLANQYMDTSQEYQKQREDLVQQNPTKFKS
jgi:hypothetical protein